MILSFLLVMSGLGFWSRLALRWIEIYSCWLIFGHLKFPNHRLVCPPHSSWSNHPKWPHHLLGSAILWPMLQVSSFLVKSPSDWTLKILIISFTLGLSMSWFKQPSLDYPTGWFPKLKKRMVSDQSENIASTIGIYQLTFVYIRYYYLALCWTRKSWLGRQQGWR